jgi:hypothetical protein
MAVLANYEVVERTGTFVSPSSTYSRSFFTLGRYSSSFLAYLEMWVKTGYSSSDSRTHAAVRLNGTEIGKISPRPWLTHSYIDFDSIAFPFDGLLLRRFTWFSFPVTPNTLEIVVPPGTTGFEYVLLAQVICHYKQQS